MGNFIFIDQTQRSNQPKFHPESITSVPFTILKSTYNFKNHEGITINHGLNGTVFRTRDNPANSITIFTSSEIVLFKVLKNLKDSRCWNHESLFLVISQDNSHGCRRAKKILRLMWSFSLFSSIFVCGDATNFSNIYAFNPYGSFAPKVWTQIQVEDIKDESWTMYHMTPTSIPHEFRTSLCETVFFTKSRNLGGYPLKAVLTSDSINHRYYWTRNGWDRFEGTEFKTLSTVLDHMNVTLIVKRYETIVYMSRYHEPLGPFKDMINGTADMWMNSLMLRGIWKLQTYPFDTKKIRILSNRGLAKLNFSAILDPEPWSLLIFIWLVGATSLKFFFTLSKSDAIFQSFGMFLANSSTILKEPSKASQRIILFILLTSFFLISCFIHSRLSAIRIVPVMMKPIENVRDLIESELPIHGPATLRDIIPEKPLLERFHAIAHIDQCFKKLMNGEFLACAFEQGTFKSQHNSAYKLHVSMCNLLERWNTFLMKDDSPLISEISRKLRRLSEGGIIKLFDQRETLHILKWKQYHKEEDVSIGFILGKQILALGWISGIIILIAELITHKINDGLCDHIYFDKLKSFSGNNFKIVLSKDEIVDRYHTEREGWRRFSGTAFRIMSAALEHLNITVTVKMYDSINWIDEFSTPLGPLKDILDGETDIWMNFFMLREYWKLQAYPFGTETVQAVSIKKFKKTKLSVILDAQSWMILFITWSLCTLMLRNVFHKSLIQAIMGSLRLFLGTSAPSLSPSKVSQKVLISTISITTLLISCFIQCRLSSLETVPVTSDGIKSIGDLITSKYPIYGMASLRDAINSHGLRDKYNIPKYLNECADRLLQGDRVVCLYDKTDFKYHEIHQSSVQISVHDLLERSNTFMFREDLPLRRRIDYLLMRLAQGGFIEFYNECEKPYLAYASENNRIRDRQASVNLGFHVLLWGCSLGFLAYVFEKIIYEIKLNYW
ncbi:hypothetical protein QAD02_006487 [Eretmocerus hayati]|uniref:Uncharacterized protein n=1 Tax=Eretmocerus hayati TaxID=131215 RepID=A0ACC2N108_9HYME|nr:hypothetical protein QAD02_006487 [Eretmocerus hayati]